MGNNNDAGLKWLLSLFTYNCFSTETDQLMVMPHSAFLSDHHFKILIYGYSPIDRHFNTRCLTDDTVSKYKKVITSVLESRPCFNRSVDSLANPNPLQINYLGKSIACSLQIVLDVFDNLKQRSVKQRRAAQWCFV